MIFDHLAYSMSVLTRPFLLEVIDKGPSFEDILKEATHRIIVAMNDKNMDVISECIEFEEGIDFEENSIAKMYVTVVFGKEDIELTLGVIIKCLKDFKSYNDKQILVYANIISEFDLECYITVHKDKKHKWLCIFEKNPDFFSRESERNVEIGLHRQMTSFKKELEAFLDGKSSKTPVEIKQMFEDFLDVEPFGFPKNVQQELEEILDNFLNCIENQTGNS